MALSIKTMKTTVNMTRRNINKIVEADKAPVLPSSNVLAKARGISATIQEKIIISSHAHNLFFNITQII